ncbi:helix-turn-helix domain-containing protein [Herbaspirillum sp. RV1423]|uniref:helix-turn-helix domain-containing protein n=1 Tax=Herbaspirillum sp. RV1423 TaxID=1443993 RepID=UPI0004B62209|nr:helix-turn-helix domain-containing protein [Herbaspirillum sp. RV1423]
MAKYETKFKHEVVKQYLSKGGNARTVGKEFGVGHGTVRRWVQSYRHHGLKGLSKKHEHYSAEFKLSVLRRMKKGRLPKCAIVVTIDEVLFHCGKAINRARLWSDASRLDRRSVPSPGEMKAALTGADAAAAQKMDEGYYTSVRNSLY